jgi:cadmium resistance protein CadD (predicted permease)
VEQELLTLLERFFVGSMLLIFLFFSVILCFVCLSYVSCVPNIASVGELFISDFLSVFYVYLTLPPFNESACTKLRK